MRLDRFAALQIVVVYPPVADRREAVARVVRISPRRYRLLSVVFPFHYTIVLSRIVYQNFGGACWTFVKLAMRHLSQFTPWTK